jgi:hypothetical protein
LVSTGFDRRGFPMCVRETNPPDFKPSATRINPFHEIFRDARPHAHDAFKRGAAHMWAGIDRLKLLAFGAKRTLTKPLEEPIYQCTS